MPYPPRRTKHTMRWEIEVGADDDARELPVEIYFSFYPGAPARYTPWPGDPPEPSDVELISVICTEDGKRWRSLTEAENDAFMAWWDKHGEDRAAEHAAECAL